MAAVRHFVRHCDRYTMFIASQDIKVTFIPDCARTISRRRSSISLSLCLLWSFLLCYMSFKSRATVIFTRLDIVFTKRVWVAIGRYQDHSYITTAFGARTFVSMRVPSIVIIFFTFFYWGIIYFQLFFICLVGITVQHIKRPWTRY